MTNNSYQKTKEKLQKEACKRYQNVSEVEKDTKPKYARERYQTFTEEEKEKSVSIIKNVSKSYLSTEEIINNFGVALKILGKLNLFS